MPHVDARTRALCSSEEDCKEKGAHSRTNVAIVDSVYGRDRKGFQLIRTRCVHLHLSLSENSAPPGVLRFRSPLRGLPVVLWATSHGDFFTNVVGNVLVKKTSRTSQPNSFVKERSTPIVLVKGVFYGSEANQLPFPSPAMSAQTSRHFVRWCNVSLSSCTPEPIEVFLTSFTFSKHKYHM